MKKLILFSVPILIMIDLYIFSFITELLRQPSDMAVTFGVVSICLAIAGNFFLITFITKQFKQKTR